MDFYLCFNECSKILPQQQSWQYIPEDSKSGNLGKCPKELGKEKREGKEVLKRPEI